jgi:hypothetical protein
MCNYMVLLSGGEVLPDNVDRSIPYIAVYWYHLLLSVTTETTYKDLSDTLGSNTRSQTSGYTLPPQRHSLLLYKVLIILVLKRVHTFY